MGRYILLSRIAKISRFHVYTSVMPFQGLFQQIYTVLQWTTAVTFKSHVTHYPEDKLTTHCFLKPHIVGPVPIPNNGLVKLITMSLSSMDSWS